MGLLKHAQFASPCQVADAQSRHEVLKVFALSELVLAGDEVNGHDSDDAV